MILPVGPERSSSQWAVCVVSPARLPSQPPPNQTLTAPHGPESQTLGHLQNILMHATTGNIQIKVNVFDFRRWSWINTSPLTAPNPGSVTFQPLLTSEDAWCPLRSPRSSGPSTESGPCPSGRTMKSRWGKYICSEYFYIHMIVHFKLIWKFCLSIQYRAK